MPVSIRYRLKIRVTAIQDRVKTAYKPALNQCYGFLTYLGVRPWPHFLVTGIGLS